MAIPRVFISSTCYDLKHIRENLKYFIRTIGYEPVLSDEGDVFYSPSSHTHDSCIKEVETCQIFILVIGGRYGGKFKDEDSSITNYEYREAIKNKIPIFTLVESGVHSDHHVFTTNRSKNPSIAEQIDFPSIDNIKIFSFIDEVRKNTQNNAIFAFKDFSDMEQYLKKQWAGLMYDFLLDRSNRESTKITNRLLDDLSLATRKSEELIKVLLRANQGDAAEENIREVDEKIQAEAFIKSLMEDFHISNLSESLIAEFKALPITDTWYEYVSQSDLFHIEDMDDDVDNLHRVVWIGDPDELRHGLGIGEVKDGRFIPDGPRELEKNYESFKNIDSKSRNRVLEILGKNI